MRIYVHEYEASRRSSDRRDRLAALYSPTTEGHASGTVQALPR
jgi:hypothetical protein